MGTPELTAESLVTVASAVGLLVAALLTLWLVVRAAVRSELRAERRRDVGRSGSSDPVGNAVAPREWARPETRGAVPVTTPALADATSPASASAMWMQSPAPQPTPQPDARLGELPPPISHTAVPISPTPVGYVMSEPRPQGPAFPIGAAPPTSEPSRSTPSPFAAADAPPQAASADARAASSSAVMPDLARQALEKLSVARPDSPDSPATTETGMPHPRPRGRHATEH